MLTTGVAGSIPACSVVDLFAAAVKAGLAGIVGQARGHTDADQEPTRRAERIAGGPARRDFPRRWTA